MPIEDQPLAKLQWLQRDGLVANDYNPNVVAPLERKLLVRSIEINGWTQPIVTLPDFSTIVDGFHRWTISAMPAIFALTDGHVPVVPIDADEADRRAATVRHNRARGSHGIDPMASLVHQLRGWGWTDDQIMQEMGMQREEVIRLAEVRGLPERHDDREVSGAWHPGERRR